MMNSASQEDSNDGSLSQKNMMIVSVKNQSLSDIVYEEELYLWIQLNSSSKKLSRLSRI